MTTESDKAFEDWAETNLDKDEMNYGVTYNASKKAFQAGRASKLDWPELKEFQKENSHKEEYSAHANFWVVEFYAWLKERMK